MHQSLCPPEIKQQRAVVSRVSAATTSTSPSVSPRSSIASPRYYHMASDATALLDLVETGGSSNSSSTESRGAAVMPCHQDDGPLQWVAGDEHYQMASPSSTFRQPQHQRLFLTCCSTAASAPLPSGTMPLSCANEDFAVTPLPVCRSGFKLSSATSQPCFTTITGPPDTKTRFMAKFPYDDAMESTTVAVSSRAPVSHPVEDPKNLTPLNEARAQRRYCHQADCANNARALPHQRPSSAVVALPGTQDATRHNLPFKSDSVKLPPQPVMSGRKVQYRKTRVCPWFTSGRCLLGDRCNYAHSKSELRGRPDLTRTRMCSNMDACMDPECRFAHGSDELRATGAFFRTKLCKFWQRGNCPAGVHCRHAHGEEQLRDPDDCSAPLAMVPHESRVLAHHLDRHQKKQQKQQHICSSTPERSRGQQQQQKLQCSKQEQQHPTVAAATSLSLLDLSSTDSSSRTRTQSAVSTVSGDSPLMDLNTTHTTTVLDEVLHPRSRHNEDELLLEAFTQLLLELAPPSSPREKHISTLSSSMTTTTTTTPSSALKTAGTASMSPHPSSGLCCPTSHETASPGDVKLKDILNLAVSSQDPELLECSAKLLRASLALRSTSPPDYPWTSSCHRYGSSLIQPSSDDLALLTTYSTPASPRYEQLLR